MVRSDWIQRSISPPFQERHLPPGAERRRIPERSGGELSGGNAEHGEVSAGVAALQLGRDAAPIRQRDGDVLVALDGGLGGDDDAIAPVDTAGRQPRAGVDGDDRLGATFNGVGELVGECRECCRQVRSFEYGFEGTMEMWRGQWYR